MAGGAREARHHILDGPRQDMPVVRQAGGERGAIVEDVLGAALAALELLPERVGVFPVLQRGLLLRVAAGGERRTSGKSAIGGGEATFRSSARGGEGEGRRVRSCVPRWESCNPSLRPHLREWSSWPCASSSDARRNASCAEGLSREKPTLRLAVSQDSTGVLTRLREKFRKGKDRKDRGSPRQRRGAHLRLDRGRIAGMVLISDFDDFYQRAAALFRADPARVRYVVKYRHCDGSVSSKSRATRRAFRLRRGVGPEKARTAQPVVPVERWVMPGTRDVQGVVAGDEARSIARWTSSHIALL